MRLSKTTAGVLATGALMFAVPAAASASTTSASPASANTPSATASSFAMVADGQTIAQVDQEMGSAGTLVGATTTPSTEGSSVDPEPAMNTEVFAWNDSSLGLLGGVLQFSVDFKAPVGQPLIVTGKTALGL